VGGAAPWRPPEKRCEHGPLVPKSGFRITQTASKQGDTHYIHVKKQSFANYGVNAGDVDDSGVIDAEVKD